MDGSKAISAGSRRRVHVSYCKYRNRADGRYGPIGTAPRKRMVQNRQKRAPVEAEIRPQEIVSQQAGPKAPKDDLMTHVKRVSRVRHVS